MSVAVFLLLTAATLVHVSDSVHFSVSLNPAQKKCFGEQLTKDVLLVADWSGNGPIAVSIANDETTIFQERDKNVAQTAFTTQVGGTHMACIQNLNKRDIIVWMNLRWGPEAKDYSQIAKKEHLLPITTSFRQFEDELHQYHDNVLYMRGRETKMRETNESTSFRVSLSCVVIIFVVLLTGLTQAYYFRGFFRAKKII